MWEGDGRIFRTYIKGKDKKSTESHKNLPGRTFEDASQFECERYTIGVFGMA